MSVAVSVIFPVRNGAGTLGRAIESCLSQTFTDFELILVDNQSSDETISVARPFLADPRVLLIAQSGGIVSALQAGCARATGAFLARMDADDVCHPTRFALQVQQLEAHAELAVSACRVAIPEVDFDNSGMRAYVDWSNSLLTPQDHRQNRFIESPLVHPSVMMRRTVFEQLGGYQDPGWAEDYDLWLRFLDAGHAIAKLPEVLLDWTDRPDRLTRQDPRYTQGRFSQAKAAYLARIESLFVAGVTICGAGPTGKHLAQDLLALGLRVHRFIDVHPGRIGKQIHGIAVCAHETLEYDGSVLLSAVGQEGVRDQVRRLARPLGFVEGVDFFCVA